jgi:hypothetical protein
MTGSLLAWIVSETWYMVAGERVLSIYLLSHSVLIRTARANSNATGVSYRIGRSLPGVDWFVMSVEMCGKIKKEHPWLVIAILLY